MNRRISLLFSTILIVSYTPCSAKNAWAGKNPDQGDNSSSEADKKIKIIRQDKKKKEILLKKHLKADSSGPAKSEDVVVTGSRIRKNTGGGNPLTVVTAKQLSVLSPESLPAGLAKLPLFAPIKSSDSASDGGYQPTGNYMDLWGLGPIRTLILQDGHRVAPTYYTGTVDVNTLPQMLVKRVEVVTGGASAVYGSDAVSGVVNFILDKSYNGIKGQIQGGESTYNDGGSFRVGLVNGFNLTRKLHFEWSAEYYKRNAIVATPRAFGTAAASVVGTGKESNPLEQLTGTRLNNSTFGGLVTTGPFTGQQFLPDGTLAPFNKGEATRTAGISVGGDGSYRTPSNLLPSLDTMQFFGRFDYDISENIKAYVQAQYGQSDTTSHEQNLISTASSTPLTIYSGNPYLQSQYQSILTADNVSSFNLNRYNSDFGNLLGLHDQTKSVAVTAGLNGHIFQRFDWDIYFTHGTGQTSQVTTNNTNTERLYAALDAVKDPATGNIVCRAALVDPQEYAGCVPLNVLGANTASQSAINYINGKTSWSATNNMENAGASINGTLFQGWAGPIKASTGIEYRYLTLDETTSVSDNAFDSTGLRVGLDGNQVPTGMQLWTKNVSGTTHGRQSVYEGNLELDVPLIRNLPLAKMISVNTAGRYTHYSTSGSVETWRVGLDWTVFPGLNIRATRSRDIRAPTLYELYQGRTATISGYTDYLTGANGQILNASQGNPNLKPEVAQNFTAGATYRPTWLPNLSMSIDYFDVKINNAISSVSGLNTSVQKLCIASGGTSPLCSLVVRPHDISDTSTDNAPTENIIENENISKIHSRGIVIATSYAIDLKSATHTIPGFATVRAQWVHEPDLKSQTLPGAVISNTAGTALAPVDRVSGTFMYAFHAIEAAVTLRYFSGFHYSADPTVYVSQKASKPYIQTDFNLSYSFKVHKRPFSAFFNVNNAFNVHGGLYEASSSNPGLIYPAAPFADQIGRYFTFGVRMGM